LTGSQKRKILSVIMTISHECIRTWMKHLSDFVHSLDLVRARPQRNWLKSKPERTVNSVLAVPGKEYAIYLADGREKDEKEAGSPIEGALVFKLPAGTFRFSCFSPVAGLYSPWAELEGGQEVRLSLPEFVHDIAVRIRK